jgi:ribonuclease D
MLPPPVWVARPADLIKMAADLANRSHLAVDTESNSLYVYREQVCLIQLSTSERDYLVDPLALSDLSPLAPIFANPGIEKIFHAAEYDLICLKRDFGITFVNIFDTMLAARILGRLEVGLGAILEEKFDVTLNKRYQRANWGQRPLPSDLLAYARLDSHYLIPLHEKLQAELMEAERWELAQEDFARACHVAIPANGKENHTCLRASGSQKFSPRQLAVLNELCHYREERASAANLPPFKVLDNHRLAELVNVLPQTRDELERSGALSWRQFDRHADGILAAIQRGLAAPPYRKPASPPRPAQRYLDRLHALREWRKETAQKSEVDSDVILPRDILEAIAQANPMTEADLAAVMTEIPWRFAHYSAEILGILKKQSPN